MRQFPLEDLDIAPGHVLEWRLELRDDEGALHDEREQSSFNQAKHFFHMEDSRSNDTGMGSWLSITFEIDGVLDRTALESAFLLLARRHEVLRCAFHRQESDLACAVYEPGEVELRTVDVGPFATSADLRAHLFRSFCGIDTLDWPLYLMGAVVRPDGPTTVYLALDHIVSDGMSVLHIVDDVQAAYAASATGTSLDLPPTGSYVEFAREQRERCASLQADDDRLGYWRSSIERSGSFFPPFSLDLGLEPGRMYPTVNVAESLLGAEEVAALEDRCRTAGGSLVTGVLAGVAVTLRKEGGPEAYHGLVPVSERGRGRWQNSVGWFVNTLPVHVEARCDMDLAALVGVVRSGLDEMRANTEVPFVRAWELLAPESYARHAWPHPANFFSYIDTTRFPEADQHPRWRPALHVWTARSNGANSWFLRDSSGLHVNHIYSDTSRAREVMAGVERTLRATLRAMAATGRAAPRP